MAGPESLEEKGGPRDQELRAEGKRILLVEDNALNREISREILEADGFAVEDASDRSWTGWGRESWNTN